MTSESYLLEENWAIGMNRITLRAIGAWPDVEKKKILKEIRIPLMVITMFVFVFIPQLYALPLVKGNFPLVIDNIISNFPALTSCCKLAIFWCEKDILRPVVNSMSEDWRRKKQKWELEAMIREAFKGRTFTVIGYSLVTMSVASFIAAPICGFNVRLFSNITDIGKRPFTVQSYYPFDYTKSPLSEMLHLSQIIGCLMIACAMSIPDHYFGILVFHIGGQFVILGVHLENLIEQDDEKFFKTKLGDCVKRHAHLINMVNLIEKSFTFVILCQVSCLCGLTCCISFRILYAFQHPSESMSIFQIITLYGALIFILVFTLNDCAASEALAHHSSKLLNNIYNSRWYASPGPSIRDLTIILCATRKAQTLSAGKIVQLSLLSFGSILRTICGYISVLFAVASRLTDIESK